MAQKPVSRGPVSSILGLNHCPSSKEPGNIHISDIYIICDFEFEWMRQQLSVNFFSCEKGVTERCFIYSFISMVYLFLFQP